jgi:hypothetical protein
LDQSKAPISAGGGSTGEAGERRLYFSASDYCAVLVGNTTCDCHGVQVLPKYKLTVENKQKDGEKRES